MNVGNEKIDDMPVIKDQKDFDCGSGNLLERLIFNNRVPVIIACALITLALGFMAAESM